jgi:signal transduction histidine kinase
MKLKGDILIVDDSKALQALISEMLQTENYSTFSVDSGEDAMVFLSVHKPELILLDRNMSGIDGFEVCKLIKANRKLAKIPIIFLTASNDSKSIVEGFKLGAVDYITKPFQREELLARVNSHIELYQITQLLKEQTKELKESEKHLQEVNAEKDKFVSIIAHDLKGPLNNILQLSNLIKKNIIIEDKNQIAELVNLLYKTADNTTKLLSNLLEWTTLQRGKMQFNPQKLQLSRVVNESFELFRSSAKAKSIELISSINDEVFVNADSNMLHTILRNLISNGIKFTEKNGTISLSAVSSSNSCTITVSDTGIGINPKTVKELFLITDSKSTYGTEGEHGTGLGLLLCKEFIAKHGGNIWVETELGKGSQFKFSLPVN